MNTFIEMCSIITNNRFPRGLGNPARGNSTSGYHIANDATEMYKFAESNKFTNVYYTVFGFGKYLNPATDAYHAIIDTLPFDFDSKNLQTSFTDARTLVSWCHKHDVIPRVTFSGNKGFHVFIDIIPIIINNPAPTIKIFCNELSDAAGFTTVDRVIFGDLNRLIRIPNTMHAKSKLYCIPIDSYEFLNLDLDTILRMAKEQQFENIKRVNNKNIEIISELLSINDSLPTASGHLIKNSESKLAKIFTHVPVGNCRAAEMLVANGVSEGARDLALSGIIRYYTLAGLPKDKIIEKCLLFDSHCDKPMRHSNIRYKVDYHMAKNYTQCTFLTKIDGVCKGCHRALSINR